MSRISKRRLTMLVLVMGVMGSVIMQRLICTNWESLALIIYGFNRLDQPDTSLTVLSQTLLIMSISELTIALIIMSIRIGSQKISPVADNDSRSIALLNRILINNIQQSFVFFGLYAYLLIIHLPSNSFYIKLSKQTSFSGYRYCSCLAGPFMSLVI